MANRNSDALDALNVLAAAGAMDNDPAAAGVDHMADPHLGSGLRDGSGRPPEEARGCTCKASKCLKLYCVCFAAGRMCGPECACRQCHNNGHFEEQKRAAVEAILERNPTAFEPKVNERSKHNKGCSCRKSGCLKRYCECFNAGVLCHDLCKCLGCKNFEGSADLAPRLASNASKISKGLPAPAHNHAPHVPRHAQNPPATPADLTSRAHGRAMSYHNYSQPYAHAQPSRQPLNPPHVHQMHQYASPPQHGYNHHGQAAPSATLSYRLPQHGGSDRSAVGASVAGGSAASSGLANVTGTPSGTAGAWQSPADFMSELAGQGDRGREALDASNSAKDQLLLQYGKRTLSFGRSDAQQPPAKRALFQRGPAFKSRFGVLGSPGGLHYRTTAVEEDRPENLKSAAAKALDPSIVSAAEEDTARLLTMFAQSASGVEIEAHSALQHGAPSKRGVEISRRGSTGDPARKNVGENDLYCEEEKLEEDEDVGSAFLSRKNDSVSKMDGSFNADDDRNEAADDPNYVTEDDDDDDDEDGIGGSSRIDASRDVSSSGTGAGGRDPQHGVSDAFRGRLHSRSSGALGSSSKKSAPAPRPPWYAAAERSALEHCAAVLRKIATSPPGVTGQSAHRRRGTGRQPPVATSRFHDDMFASEAPVAPVNGTVIPGSPPLPRG